MQDKVWGGRTRTLCLGVVLLGLAACSTVKTPETPVSPVPPVAPPIEKPVPDATKPDPIDPKVPVAEIPEVARLSALPGWDKADGQSMIASVLAACDSRRRPDLTRICEDLRTLKQTHPKTIKAYLNDRFRTERIGETGLLTAYYAPEYPASAVKTDEFSAAVRLKPDDLLIVDGAEISPDLSGQKVVVQSVAGRLLPYPEREAIEAIPVDSDVWMRPEDYFFMQLQGSGYLRFADGTSLHAAYAADNGRPFVGIARPMVERGILGRDQSSGENIRRWLADNRGPKAQEIMNLNPRYAFFRIEPDNGKDPVGAANVPLPAGASGAIDPAFHRYGDLMWIDANAPGLNGAFPIYQRMIAALDTGGAIKGQVRVDLYMGRGDAAGREAGRVKHALRKWRIVPAAR
ncbi:MAG: MltA domain-containing protein [Asticcacaulis sp.]